MRNVIVGAFVSLDGVMQGPGGPTEDPTGGFPFGGWAVPYMDPVFGEEIDRLMEDRFDLLLGRKTYEIFAAHWPYAEGGPDDAIAKLFKGIKKYVVSREGDVDTSWAGSVLLRDAVADVERLKHEDGPNLITQGSTELVHTLLANDLVDGLSIFTFPVVLGGGKKLFADGSSPRAFELKRSRVSSSGIMVAHYERDGEVKIGDTSLDAPSEAETGRQARMQREG